VYFLFADFAMVAKLQNVPNVKKAEIRQALRCKLNSLRFSKTKPGYYKGKPIYKISKIRKFSGITMQHIYHLPDKIFGINFSFKFCFFRVSKNKETTCHN
jgi:hypothetical protein